jgi:hypothetical protein
LKRSDEAGAVGVVAVSLTWTDVSKILSGLHDGTCREGVAKRVTEGESWMPSFRKVEGVRPVAETARAAASRVARPGDSGDLGFEAMLWAAARGSSRNDRGWRWAGGVSEGGAADGAVMPYLYTAVSKSKLGYDLLTAINAERLKLFGDWLDPALVEQSDRRRELLEQAGWARRELLANQVMRWSVPESKGHDDLLNALALVVQVGPLAARRLAAGRRPRQGLSGA